MITAQSETDAIGIHVTQNAIITMVTRDRSPIIIRAGLRLGHVALAGNVSGKMEDTGEGGGGEGLILKLVHGEGPSRITLDSNRFQKYPV